MNPVVKNRVAFPLLAFFAALLVSFAIPGTALALAARIPVSDVVYAKQLEYLRKTEKSVLSAFGKERREIPGENATFDPRAKTLGEVFSASGGTGIGSNGGVTGNAPSFFFWIPKNSLYGYMRKNPEKGYFVHVAKPAIVGSSGTVSADDYKNVAIKPCVVDGTCRLELPKAGSGAVLRIRLDIYVNAEWRHGINDYEKEECLLWKDYFKKNGVRGISVVKVSNGDSPLTYWKVTRELDFERE